MSQINVLVHLPVSEMSDYHINLITDAIFYLSLNFSNPNSK